MILLFSYIRVVELSLVGIRGKKNCLDRYLPLIQSRIILNQYFVKDYAILSTSCVEFDKLIVDILEELLWQAYCKYQIK